MAKVESKSNKPWTEKKMLAKLVGEEGSMFPCRRNLCVPNVSWGFLDYEADLLVVTGSDWLKEIEIKISVADLKADIKKKKHKDWESPRNPVKDLYYAIPFEVWEKIKENPPVPDHAGIIVIHDVNANSCGGIVKYSKSHKYARKLFLEEKAILARLGTLRYWSLLHKEVKNV